jgi:hypothetical protein
MSRDKCVQCYLGRTNVNYPFPFIQGQIQTHGFNGLMAKHKGFLQAYKEMTVIDEKQRKACMRSCAVMEVTNIDIYPRINFIVTGANGGRKPNFTYCKTI